MVSEIQKIKDDMLRLGFDGALMSGSGSCVFGMTQDEDLIDSVYSYFKNNYYFVRKTQILKKEDKK